MQYDQGKKRFLCLYQCNDVIAFDWLLNREQRTFGFIRYLRLGKLCDDKKIFSSSKMIVKSGTKKGKFVRRTFGNYKLKTVT